MISFSQRPRNIIHRHSKYLKIKKQIPSTYIILYFCTPCPLFYHTVHCMEATVILKLLQYNFFSINLISQPSAFSIIMSIFIALLHKFDGITPKFIHYQHTPTFNFLFKYLQNIYDLRNKFTLANSLSFNILYTLSLDLQLWGCITGMYCNIYPKYLV